MLLQLMQSSHFLQIMKPWAKFALAAFLIHPFVGQSSDGFEIGGTMETVTVTRTNRRTFVVQSDGTNVFIQYRPGPLDQGVRGTEFGTDGTNGFYMDRHNGPQNQPDLVNDSSLDIERSPVPPRLATGLAAVWLAYASHLFLAGKTEDYLPPRNLSWVSVMPRNPETARIFMPHILFRASWEFDPLHPGFLKRFIEYREAKFDTDRYSSSLIPALLKTGVTNSSMEVIAWTNVNGLNFPSEVRMVNHGFDTNGSAAPKVSVTHRLRLTHVDRYRTRATFIPEVSRATRVVDRRFADQRNQPPVYMTIDGMLYHSDEDVWGAVVREEERNEARRKLKPAK